MPNYWWFVLFLFMVLAIVGVLVFLLMVPESEPNRWIWLGFTLSGYAVIAGFLLFLISIEADKQDMGVINGIKTPEPESDYSILLFLIIVLLNLGLWKLDRIVKLIEGSTMKMLYPPPNTLKKSLLPVA